MKKKFSKIIACAVFAIVAGLSICLAVLLPKNTKADPNSGTEPGYQVNGGVVNSSANGVSTAEESATETGADTAPISEKGGSVLIEKKGSFTMNGGVIRGHNKTYGGAVYVSDGATFTMNGGTISGNTAAYGGAIYVESGGTCIINGGSIVSNGATVSPAIHLEPGAILEIGENAIIENNYKVEFYYTVNYYVDGVFVSEQHSEDLEHLDLSEASAPLTYEECSGYYLEEDLVTNIDENTALQPTDAKSFGPNMITGVADTIFKENSKTLNLYTKTATKGLQFTVLDQDTYVVSANANDVEGELVIPREFANKKVVAIAEHGFSGQSGITSVVFPATVKTINSYAFENCDNLKEITISPYVNTVKGYAFAKSGLNAIVVLDGCYELENYAFAEIDDLLVVYMPDSLAKVGESIFRGDLIGECDERLSNVTVFIGDVIGSIEAPAGWDENWDCYNYSDYDGDGKYWSTINTKFNADVWDFVDFISYDEDLYEENPDYTFIYGYISGYVGTASNITLPANAKGLLTNSLINPVIKNIYVPSNLICVNETIAPGELDVIGPVHSANESIKVYFAGQESFSVYCNSWYLETKESVTESNFNLAIQNPDFDLEGTTLLKYIGPAYGAIYIPEGVTRIVGRAFDGLTGNYTIQVPSTVKKIDDYAFSNSGTGSIYIPESLTDVGSKAFVDCKKTIWVPLSSTVLPMNSDVWHSWKNAEGSSFVEGWVTLTGADVEEGAGFYYRADYIYGDGSESHPYLINSIEGIKEMITYCEQTSSSSKKEVYPTITRNLTTTTDASGNTTTTVTSIETKRTFFKLVSDVDFKYANLSVEDTNIACINFDGDGYSFKNFGKASFASGYSLFGTLYCSNIWDLNVYFNSSIYPLVNTVRGITADDLTGFFRVNIYSQDGSDLIIDAEDSSCSPYVYFSRGGTLAMVECVNNANIICLAPYAAVFVGGSCTGNIMFNECVNNGDFFCANNGAIFIGNNYYKPAGLTLTDCENNGNLSYCTTGNPKATILAAYTSGRNWKLNDTSTSGDYDIEKFNNSVEGKLSQNGSVTKRTASDLSVSISGNDLIVSPSSGGEFNSEWKSIEVTVSGRMYADPEDLTSASYMIFVKNTYEIYDSLQKMNCYGIWNKFYDYETYCEEVPELDRALETIESNDNYNLYYASYQNLYVVEWLDENDKYYRTENATDKRYYIVVVRNSLGKVVEVLSVQVMPE